MQEIGLGESPFSEQNITWMMLISSRNTASAEVAENEAHRQRFRRWHM
jgi:hypothetical protein